MRPCNATPLLHYQTGRLDVEHNLGLSLALDTLQTFVKKKEERRLQCSASHRKQATRTLPIPILWISSMIMTSVNTKGRATKRPSARQ